MNPLKSNNIVAKILQVYAYVNGAVGIILALSKIWEHWWLPLFSQVFSL